LRHPVSVELPGPLASEQVSEMTSEEAITSLFPKRVVEKVKRSAGVARSATEPRYFDPPSPTEARCRTLLERLRWPEGVRCPRCEASKGISRIESRGQFECGSCGYQFSVRVGTTFQASHVPLWKWFLAVYVMVESSSGISARQLMRMLGVSYKTALHLTHRIRGAMKDEAPRSGRRFADAERVVGGHAGANVKHVTPYIDEMSYRARNRGSPYLFRDMLLRLIGVKSVPSTRLIANT
jgi:transposase-like protein